MSAIADSETSLSTPTGPTSKSSSATQNRFLRTALTTLPEAQQPWVVVARFARTRAACDPWPSVIRVDAQPAGVAAEVRRSAPKKLQTVLHAE